MIEKEKSSKSQGSKRNQQSMNQPKNDKKKEEGQMLLFQKRRTLQVWMQNPSKQKEETRFVQQCKQKSGCYDF